MFDYWNFRLSYREAGTEEKELNGNIIQDVLYPMAANPLPETIPPKNQNRIPQCLNAHYEPFSLNEFYHSMKILVLVILFSLQRYKYWLLWPCAAAAKSKQAKPEVEMARTGKL